MAEKVTFLAYRDEAASADELRKATELTHGYWRDYEQKDKYSGPETYLEDGGPIYSGAMELPATTEQDRLDYLNYWLTWLTDLTRLFTGARWTVELGGAPLTWDEQLGWKLYEW